LKQHRKRTKFTQFQKTELYPKATSEHAFENTLLKAASICNQILFQAITKCLNKNPKHHIFRIMRTVNNHGQNQVFWDVVGSKE